LCLQIVCQEPTKRLCLQIVSQDPTKCLFVCSNCQSRAEGFVQIRSRFFLCEAQTASLG
jgi:hypothetical protein